MVISNTAGLMDTVSKAVRSKIMSHIKSQNTKPELIFRKTIWKMGARYKIQYGPEHIDVAFPSRRVAVFIDGCFWHSCPTHGHIPMGNRAYWSCKLELNRRRSDEKDRRLMKSGWHVIHIWEHEIAANKIAVASKVMHALGKIPLC